MDPYAMYRPIRRISQACLSCRRKKARCSGQRPECSNCSRLSIKCHYEEHPSTAADVSEAPASKDGIDNVLRAVNGLQEKLGDLQNTIELLANRQEHIQRSLAVVVDTCTTRANCNSLQQLSPAHAILDGSSPVPLRMSGNEAEKTSGLPLAAIRRIVDTYFTICHNQPYSFFHELNFRRKLADGQIPHHLVCAIIATAIRFSDDPFWENDKNEIAEKFASKAWACIISTELSCLEVSNLYTVQSITLLAIFDYTAGRSRHGSAWVKIGVAIRIAQDLKLMLPPPTDLPPAVQEERRRVFWSIFLLDRLASCGRDLPCSILESSCRLQLPLSEAAWRDALNESNIALDSLVNRERAGAIPPQSHSASVVIVAHMLSKVSQYMIQQSDSSHSLPPWDPRSELAIIESDMIHLGTTLQLQRPLTEVVAEFTGLDGRIDQQCLGPAIFSRVLFHLCYCVLHHPFLHRKKADTCRIAYPPILLFRSLETGFTHARELTLLIKEAAESRCLVQASFYGYCAMVAGYIVCLHTGSDKERTRSEARSLLYTNLAYLDDLGQMWRNASFQATALRQLSEAAPRFSVLVGESGTLSLSPEDEEMLWSFVDYNTMSNGVVERNTAESSRTGGVYWPDINDQWCDLFAPRSRMSPALDLDLC